MSSIPSSRGVSDPSRGRSVALRLPHGAAVPRGAATPPGPRPQRTAATYGFSATRFSCLWSCCRITTLLKSPRDEHPSGLLYRTPSSAGAGLKRRRSTAHPEAAGTDAAAHTAPPRGPARPQPRALGSARSPCPRWEPVAARPGRSPRSLSAVAGGPAPGTPSAAAPCPPRSVPPPADGPATGSAAAGRAARSRKWRPLPYWRASASLPAVQNGGRGGPEPSIAEPPWSRGAGPRASSQWASARGLEAPNGERRRCRAAPRAQWERRELGAQSPPARLGAALRRAGAEAAVSCPGAWWSDGGIVGKFLGEVRI